MFKAEIQTEPALFNRNEPKLDEMLCIKQDA